MSFALEQVINEHFENEKGRNNTMENTRTLAFAVSEEFFQLVKEYLAWYEEVYHRRLTQKQFIIGLIEDELERNAEAMKERRNRLLPAQQTGNSATATDELEAGYAGEAAEDEAETEYGEEAAEDEAEAGYGEETTEDEAETEYSEEAAEDEAETEYGEEAAEDEAEAEYGEEAVEDEMVSEDIGDAAEE